VKRSGIFSLPAVLGLFIALATPQSAHHFPTPPEAQDDSTKPQPSQETPTRHVDMVQIQKDADNLARTAQTIPTDVANVRKGMLPKDVIEKLKQIEKLSKHLRSELNP
jgi:hypothetical protein